MSILLKVVFLILWLGALGLVLNMLGVDTKPPEKDEEATAFDYLKAAIFWGICLLLVYVLFFTSLFDESIQGMIG